MLVAVQTGAYATERGRIISSECSLLRNAVFTLYSLVMCHVLSKRIKLYAAHIEWRVETIAHKIVFGVWFH